MALFHWDTSALVRRYLPGEPGASRVRLATQRSAGNRHLATRLVAAEVASALAAKARANGISVEQRDLLWRRFLVDAEHQYELLQLSEATWNLAQTVLFRRAVRAPDAIHLAAALVISAEPFARDLVFWTADTRQAAAAAAEGLRVELVA